MCTPIGHSLAGAAVYRAGSNYPGHNIRLFIFILLCANLPDMDFIFGYPEGNPNLYHHTWTHSLAFCLITGILVTLTVRLFNGNHAFIIGLSAFGAVVLHLIMDFFTIDQNPPFGIKALWPVNQKFYISSVMIFRDVYKASSSGGFIQSLFCRHNLIAVLVEIVIVGPVYGAVHLLTAKRKPGI